MLFTRAALDGIATGAVSLAFRRWRVARMRPGSTCRTAIGVVRITSLDAIDPEDITPEEARRAGFATLRDLHEELARHRDGQLYRVGVRFDGEDPRIALGDRQEVGADERDAVLARVAGLGARSSDGAWGIRTLRLIESSPATRAAKLAQTIGMDTHRFKARVRQLKEMGLTESLDIGYRLSPRGVAVLRLLNERWPLDRR